MSAIPSDQTASLPLVDDDELLDVLVTLLRTPSPSGRTDQAVQLVGDYVSSLGLACEVTRRGALRIEIPGQRKTIERALIAHVDTLGAMVSALKDNGRLSIVPIGTHSARFVEGARCTIFVDDLDRPPITGTILPLKASGHRYNKEVDSQPSAWTNLEVRVDELVHGPDDLAALGIQIGDHVGLDAVPVITPSGHINSRHLDDKAGVAALLAALRVITEIGEPLPVGAHALITITEEVGHGASHGIEEDVAELVAIDNGVCAPGQASSEHTVGIAMVDMHGPFDYHLTRRLISLCEEHDIAHQRDVFGYYRSDAAAALEAGLATRAALVTFGLDASHGWERTHIDSLRGVANLLVHYLRSELTFQTWDRSPWGPLREFPSTSVQPAPTQGPR